MEIEGGHNIKKIVCLYEAIGSALLIIALNWSNYIHKDQFAPIGLGLTLFSCITIFGPVCGGHFNPAVTIGVLVREGKQKFKSNIAFCIYIILS